jgi:hypothetical protein
MEGFQAPRNKQYVQNVQVVQAVQTPSFILPRDAGRTEAGEPSAAVERSEAIERLERSDEG